jgi:hypothetical protein
MQDNGFSKGKARQGLWQVQGYGKARQSKGFGKVSSVVVQGKTGKGYGNARPGLCYCKASQWLWKVKARQVNC